MSIVGTTGIEAPTSSVVQNRNDDSRKTETAFADVLDAASTAPAQASEQEGAQEELPIEAYMLPKWYKPYAVDSGYVLQVNHAAFKYAEQLSSDGDWSNADRAAMASYLDRDPIHQDMLRHDSFMREHRTEIDEYYDILDKAFNESLEEHGVHGARDYYESVVLDQANSEAVHQTMEAKLKEQPRFLGLTEALGTSFV